MTFWYRLWSSTPLSRDLYSYFLICQIYLWAEWSWTGFSRFFSGPVPSEIKSFLTIWPSELCCFQCRLWFFLQLWALALGFIFNWFFLSVRFIFVLSVFLCFEHFAVIIASKAELLLGWVARPQVLKSFH